MSWGDKSLMSIYKPTTVSDVSHIWNALGTFWGEFEDKEFIEVFWSGLLSAARLAQRDLYYLTQSRTLSTLPPIIESEHDFYTIYFSGVNQNAYLISGSVYAFDLPRYAYYISGLYEVTYSGGTNDFNYTELVETIDYNFSTDTLYTLQLSSIPSGLESRKYYIPLTKKINSALIDVYGKAIGYDLETWRDGGYTSYVTQFGDDVSGMVTATSLITSVDLNILNLKYLIWGLYQKERAAITHDTFKDAISLVAGLPFTWYSGLVADFDSTNYSWITIDHGSQYQYRYITYSGNVVDGNYTEFSVSGRCVVGSGLRAFEPLSDLVPTIYDYDANPDIVTTDVGDEDYQGRRNLVLHFPSGILSGLLASNHDGVFFTAYKKNLFPRSLQIYMYGKDWNSGVSGLLPLPLVQYIRPSGYQNINIGSRSQINLNWYPVAYADSYNVYYVQGTTSGFLDTPEFYKNTEDTSTNFYPTITGILTHWVRWKVHPVTQGYESPNADITMFSYTRNS